AGAVLPAAAASRIAVKRGANYGSRIFPSNHFTVRDPRQVTGLRVHFRKGLDYPSYKGRVRRACGASDYSICDAFAELNKLDGFDLQPRVTVPFTGGIRLSSVNDTNFFISTRSGKFVSGLRQLTFDPAHHTLAGLANTAGRKLTFTQNGKADVFLASSVAPSLVDPLNGMIRNDQVKANPKAPAAFSASAVPNLIPTGAAGYFAFGSFLSPRYQFASSSAHQDQRYGVGKGHTDGEIPPVPTKRTARPFGADRLGVIAVTPDPNVHPPPWPAAVYGPGFTRSDYDIFVSADYNAS